MQQSIKLKREEYVRLTFCFARKWEMAVEKQERYMNKSRKSFSLEEGKIQASILLKSLRSDDASIIEQAAKRFLRLPEFSTLSITDILKENIKRKHALNVIASENGFHSWTDLKSQIRFIIGGHLNNWFTTYEEAKSYQKTNGGFLFPYKNQFFVCSAAYVRDIGFDPDDANWKMCDFDWVKPLNHRAWQALYREWSKTI